MSNTDNTNKIEIMSNTKKIEVIQKIINSNKIVAENKSKIDDIRIWYIQSFLLHYLTEEEIQWLWEDN